MQPQKTQKLAEQLLAQQALTVLEQPRKPLAFRIRQTGKASQEDHVYRPAERIGERLNLLKKPGARIKCRPESMKLLQNGFVPTSLEEIEG